MAFQDAKQDRNQFPGLLVVQGTAGTADIDPGTSILLRVGGNPVTGAMYVEDLAGATGTTNVSGTVVASNIITGTQATLGTVGVLNSGSVVVTAGTIGDLDTVGTVGVLNSGSVVMTSGTVSVLNTVGTVGVINAGSVVATLGTVVGKQAVGAILASNNPLLMAGTWAGGTISIPAVDDTGLLSTRIDLITDGITVEGGTVDTIASLSGGTVSRVGTMLNLDKGTITRVEGGSIVQTAGTVTTGSIVVTTGTIVQASGTLTTGSIVVTSGTIGFEGLTGTNSGGIGTSMVIKAAAGTLFQIFGHSSRTSSQYIHVYNATSAPAAGGTPVITFIVPASSNFSVDFQNGHGFATGITVGNSTTVGTRTAGAADTWFNALYK